MVNQLPLDTQALQSFCMRWHIAELAVFGSILGPNFRPDSDVDLLVRFTPGVAVKLSNRLSMIEELEAILGRRVDLVVESTLKNPFRRSEILKTRQVIYRAA